MAFSNSSLVTYTNISPNKTVNRTHAIDTISIHCAVAQWTAKQGCDYFASEDVGASCNYFVGKDGSIGLCVEEKDRSWCTSSADNDHRAITIETASDTTHPYAVTDAAYNALIDLLVDVCQRNGIASLKWQADPSLIGQVDKQNMTVHRWFSNKECPGEYLYSRHGAIAAAVNARLGGGGDTPTEPETDHPYAEYIWNYFMGKLGNPYGVAALMGNLEAESGLYPNIVQGDVPISSTSETYTLLVDVGQYTKASFIGDGLGYGLAQWTFSTRKAGLYDMKVSGGYSSIGSIELACDYLYYELYTSFTDVVATLVSATDIRSASDKVLHDFESPADQSEAVEIKRAGMGQAWYNIFTGGGGDTPSQEKKGMSLLMMFMAIRGDF